MINSPLIKRFLIISIYLFANGFYTFAVVPEPVRKLLEFVGIGIILLILIIHSLSGDKAGVKQNFKVEIILFLIATFFSMLMANGIHNQSFDVTFVVQRYMYFYFFYFFLHALKVNAEDMEKLIIPLGLIYVFLYFIQLLAYPAQLFDTRTAFERGTLRVLIPGMEFAVIAFMKSLQNFLNNYKIRDALLALVFFSVTAILQGTRQSLAGITLMTVAFIFFSNQVKSRALIITLAGIAGIALFLMFQDIFIQMLELTSKQTATNKPNIRIVSMIFYVTEFMTSAWAYIFGNGQDSLLSEYGIKVYFYRAYLGLHQSDIGVIGEYSKFGLFYVIAVYSIILRIIFKKIPHQLEYFRYYTIILLLFMYGGTTPFGKGEGIVFITIMLYIYDLYKHKQDGLQIIDKR